MVYKLQELTKMEVERKHITTEERRTETVEGVDYETLRSETKVPLPELCEIELSISNSKMHEGDGINLRIRGETLNECESVFNRLAKSMMPIKS